MPRQLDPKLEERVLDAAQRLWKKGGARALTMRAVAAAARTNTPAVYRRFRNRDDILLALLRRIQQEFSAIVQPTRSPQDACESFLKFALDHSNEYKLFYEHVHKLPRPSATAALRESRPTMYLMEQKLADYLGGNPSDHARLSLALWALTHGTAMILITKSIPPEHADELRSAFKATVETILREGQVSSKG